MSLDHSAPRRSFLAALALSILVPALWAQVVPSVTSLGFSRNPPGIWPSVTSPGFGQNTPFFTQPFFTQPCCINPFFAINVNQPFFHHHGRHHFSPFVGVALPIYSTPYYYPPGIVEPVDDTIEENYGRGPRFLDRRGFNRDSVAYEQQYDERLQRLERQIEEVAANSKLQPPVPAAPEVAAAEQPTTVLVFRDGHAMKVKNYAIVGDMLYIFSTDRRRKVALSDLDLIATEKQNDDRGVDFRLPGHQSAN
jgi:hypothetical protein